MNDQIRFDGRVVVVTGAGNGLGRAHALLFASRGAMVVVNDLGGGRHGEGRDISVAEQVVKEICEAGGEAVANTDSVEEGDKIIQCALDNFDRVDVVINNAGILRDRSFHKMTNEEWKAVYRVHLLGAYRVTQAAWPYMRDQQYGRVVMTSSAAGIYGNFGQANYSAAKLGLHGLAQTLAIEGRSRGIQVNTIAPIAGSRMFETIASPAVSAALDPGAISPLVAFLSHESCTDTGRLFEVGAGWVSRVRWQRSRGVRFGLQRPHSIEDIAGRWGEINDFDNASYPEFVDDTTEIIGEILGQPFQVEPQI